MGRRRMRLKDVLAAKLAYIPQTASAIERVALKVEAILDAFIEAEEFTGRLRRRADAGDKGGDFMEIVIDRILESVEGVVEIPFEDEEESD